MRQHKLLVMLCVLALVAMLLAACGGSTDTPVPVAAPTATTAAGGPTATTAGATDSGSGVTITYQLWDSNQQPAYQACADEFHKQNPGITVKLTQLGWDDYWRGIQTGMVGATAPDVFTDHLAK